MMTDNRIVYAELMGQQYPMCLTVSADALIVEEFGSMQEMWAALKGEHAADVVDTYVELSAILLEGGRDRVNTLAKLQGEAPALPPVFNLRENWGILTQPELTELTNAALRAFVAGRSRTVEAVPPKKHEATQ